MILSEVSLGGLKRWRKWGTFFKKSSDPYVKVAVGGHLSSAYKIILINLPFSGISFESKVHYQNLNPDFKFVCEIPVGNILVCAFEPPSKVEEPRGQSVSVIVWDHDPVR